MDAMPLVSQDFREGGKKDKKGNWVNNEKTNISSILGCAIFCRLV